MQIGASGFALNTNYQRNQQLLSDSMSRLSSGDRFGRYGTEPAATVSMSQRIRHLIKAADASTPALQTAMNYAQTADSHLEIVEQILTRMTEIAASAVDGTKVTADLAPHETEFQALKGELSSFARTTRFLDKPVVGRDTIVSYDGSTDRIKFWLPDGQGEGQIERDFGANALDALQQEIGFDATESFSMSRDGRSLYYLGTVTGDPAGNVRIKRYDLDNHTVTTGTDLFDSGDTLFVDEDGDLTVNGNGTLYDIDKYTMGRTATAVVDMSVGVEYSIYKNDLTYHRSSDNNVVQYDLGTAASTVLTGPVAFGAGVDNTVSASGRYMADEAVAGQIRVIDTRSGDIASYAIGVANAVTDLHFNEDGDRIYYIDQTDNKVKMLKVESDVNGQLILTDGGTIIEGQNANNFNGLDLGGSYAGSRTDFVVHQGSVSVLNYESADIRLYHLGLANTHVDTQAEADQALADLKEASNRLHAERAKIRSRATHFEYLLQGHRAYIANTQAAESTIRDVDVARESTRYSSAQVKHQAAAAVLAQFQQISKSVLTLLQV